MSDQLVSLLEKAGQAVGRLDGLSTILPNLELFLYFYVRKEAVLSSQIEGTQSTLSDLLLFENAETPGVPLADVREVSSYVNAIETGLSKLNTLPFSSRLIRKLHAILLSHGRGSDQQPGEFRTSQNLVGGSRPGNALYVPPPPEVAVECISDLERYIHDKSKPVPTLVKAALVHVQFQTIHPFLDGNGRIGRLLITLLLCAEGVLQKPLLYLSLFFKTNRAEYYRLLQAVRENGSWEDWLEFFLTGVHKTADQAVFTARSILEIFDEDHKRIESSTSGGSTLKVHQYLQRHAIMSVPSATKEIGLSLPTIRTAIATLVELGIAKEITGKARHQVFAYDRYLKTLNDGTEPLKAAA